MGQWVAALLEQLTDERATREATEAQAGPTVTISDVERLDAHRDSAQLRLDRITRPT